MITVVLWYQDKTKRSTNQATRYLFQGVDVKIPHVEYKPLDMYALHKVQYNIVHFLHLIFCALSCIIIHNVP